MPSDGPVHPSDAVLAELAKQTDHLRVIRQRIGLGLVLLLAILLVLLLMGVGVMTPDVNIADFSVTG